MLSHIHIRDFAIIEKLDLSLETGFTVITGETGAGKSIIVDALALLLGARADKDYVRAGSKRADLTAEFDLRDWPASHSWLIDQALDEDRQCIVRRTLSAEGGSRAFINGRAVTLGQMQELGAQLVQIHGQHEHQRLLNTGEQLRLLDDCGVERVVLQAVEQSYDAWRDIRRQLEELEQQTDTDPQYIELLQFQLNELDQQAISPQEFQALEQEHNKLSHAGQLIESLDQAAKLLAADDGGVNQQLGRAIDGLGPVTRYDQSLSGTLAMLEEARINIQEAESELQQALDQVDSGPERLQQLDQQLSRLHDLARKHRIQPRELLSRRDELGKQLQRSSQRDDLQQSLQQALNSALEDYHRAAEKLTEQRGRVASRLVKAVNQLLPQLGLEKARFSIDLSNPENQAPSRHGLDLAEFQIRSNPGQPSRSLAKIASGGELSRLALAIKAAAGKGDAIATQVFDEIDAGIGGETANQVGRLLAGLAAGRQALCVTHLAQVAACADQQVSVLKETGRDATAVSVVQLDGDSRIEEIARMLSGRLSDQSRAHAAELLQSKT